ncbi:hypothetical protein FOMPIDRAFT_1028998 [Fomitopsis schrenkii]|uniref:Uncharacterized protein n=1 Tax=Fomitopsis schrenkii TaxID=2126942 RepID=S8EEP8_FOMSC|nr:hypothetical protein FOMPIDRAFT_1028998 [Fomitopsis schrenkii]
MVSSGTYPVDLVFSSGTLSSEEVASLTGLYWSCRSTLVKFIDHVKAFVSKYDMKSLDPRGILSIVVDKPTYERLGLVGTRMCWKGCADMYHIPDDPATRKLHRYSSKQESALAAWDAELEPWHIFYYTGPNVKPFEGAVAHEVKPHVSQMPDVWVPEPVLQPYPTSEEDKEDWTEECSELFEWTGMACLGSQRLLANDRCDPYLAAYIPPGTSRVSTVTHVRWRGLLSSEFTQIIVDALMKKLAARAAFAAVTVHGVPTAPVTYISPSSPLSTRMRLPRPESEDTWTLLMSSQGVASEPGFMCRWVLAESIGKWDSRWG